MSRGRCKRCGCRCCRCNTVVVRRDCCNNGIGGNGLFRGPGVILGIAVVFLLLGRNRSC